jgi:glycosyltransferase involved in cell wall biosynthesis
MRRIEVCFVNDNAFSLGFGGKEIQLLSYERYLQSTSDVSVTRLDPWNKSALAHCDVLHLFGSSKGLHTIARAARLNHPKLKLVISPNFFVDNEWLESFVAKTVAKWRLPNVFSYRRELFNFADVLIVNSESERNQLEQTYVPPGRGGPDIVVIKNGVEDDFSKLEDLGLFCHRFGVEPGYFLAVAFLDERKNSLRLLKAYVESLSHHNRKLVLIGSFRFSNKKLINECTSLIKRYSDRIVHVPYIDRAVEPELLKSAYANCHAHLLPSILETPGISTLEALAYGKPVLAGECKPVRDYFGESVTYCNPYSIKDISDNIIRLSIIRELNVPDSVSKKFYWSELLQMLPGVYQNICNITIPVNSGEG